MEIASKAGLAAAGLTDHDNIGGLPDAAKAAEKYGIELIPGVELSVCGDEHDIHILGYYPRERDQLMSVLRKIQEERFNRMEAVVRKLKQLNIKITGEEIMEEAKDAAPGRMHIARTLLRKKYVHNVSQAFSTYLNKNKPAYVPRKTLNLRETMNLLHDVKAITVIAHPGKHGKSIIDKLLKMGLKGIEVFHPDHNRMLIKYYQQLAQNRGLLITGGSDFHGVSRDKINYPCNYAVPGEYLESMKQNL